MDEYEIHVEKKHIRADILQDDSNKHSNLSFLNYLNDDYEINAFTPTD